MYHGVKGKYSLPGDNTAKKIRPPLHEIPLNPPKYSPALPPGFCDTIAAMMDKNPDKRTPTASAVVELLRPWRDENATKHLAEANPPGSGIFFRGGAPAPPASAALDEAASFVLDDLDFPPGQVEGPSQISQGTVSVASETEDTLAGGAARPRNGHAPGPATGGREH